jgi:membrane protein
MAQTESPLVRITNAVKYAAAFLSLLWRQFNRDGCRDSAAALTYTTLFAIVPMMTVMFAILSAIPTLRQRGDAIREWAFENFAPGAGEQVMIYLQEFSRQATNLTAIGVVFLFITSILMLRKIETTMNTIWQVSKPRQGVTSWLMY